MPDNASPVRSDTDSVLLPVDFPRPVRRVVYGLLVAACLGLAAPVLVFGYAEGTAFVNPDWSMNGASYASWFSRSLWAMLAVPAAFVLAGLLVTLTQLVRGRGTARALRDGSFVAVAFIVYPAIVGWEILKTVAEA